MKFGFEGECFVANKDTGVLALATKLPHDSCGYLAEIRGEAHSDPELAHGLFIGAARKLNKEAHKLGLCLVYRDVSLIPADVLRAARRECSKGPTKYCNIYGLDYKPTDRTRRAGMHVHVSDETKVQEYNSRDGRVYASDRTFPRILNFPPFIQAFDKAFKDEIKVAKRLPGFYELKSYGFEYRSLPATVDLAKVVEVLDTARKLL